jgi:hypothetical protein
MMSARVMSRYARQHGGEARPEGLQMILADGGVISADDLHRLLKDRVGPLSRVRFRAFGLGPVVEWEAFRADGDLVVGRLVLHAVVGIDEVVVWANLIIDGKSKVNRTAAHDVQLAEIAYMGRTLIRWLGETPGMPVPLIIGEVVGMVDVAEREVDE